MTLVHFSKPRARHQSRYTQQHGWYVSWTVEISWSCAGKNYKSIGEHADLECALRHCFRPVIEQGWIRHVPAHWTPDSLKPLQVMARLNHYGEAP